MDRKRRFNDTKEMLVFLRETKKRNEASRRKADKEFKNEKKIWEVMEHAVDLDLEKKKHEAYLKDIKKIIREQKALVEKMERMMRQPEGRQLSKAKKYKSISNKSALATEPMAKYKSMKK
jgi:vacuolar-type H+-ATPase subunit I/STV1